MNNASKTRLTRTVLTCTAAIVAVAFSLAGASASADHRDRVIRVHIPVHEHGPETIRLGRLIRHQRHLDLDDYRLKAVVISNGPFSHGYATLRVGDRRTGRYFLSGWDKVRIDAPGRAGDRWRLRLGPGTQVRTITAVLEPRPRAFAQRRWHGRRPGASHGRGYRDHGYYDRGYQDHTAASRWRHDRIKGDGHKHIKHRRDRLEERTAHQDRRERAERPDRQRDADDRNRDRRERDVRRYAGGSEAPNRRT